MKLNRKGFSLLELIVSMAILAVLSGLLAPQLFRYVEKSKEARDLQTLDTVYMAVQAAVMDEEVYESLSGESGGAFSHTLALKSVDTDEAFGETMESLLGDLTKIRLLSGKAKKGAVCIKIRCSSENEWSISVYSGSSLAPGKRVGSLEVVGDPLTE